MRELVEPTQRVARNEIYSIFDSPSFRGGGALRGVIGWYYTTYIKIIAIFYGHNRKHNK